MSNRLPVAVGGLAVTAAVVVLLAWIVGMADAPRLVSGWRVMVPSTAFGFLLAGCALVLIGRRPALLAADAMVVRGLAALMLVLPVATALEYATGSRWGVERWLAIAIPGEESNPFAGRMSAMTSLAFVLLAVALAALTWRGRLPFGVVRVAGGAVLSVSWFAVLAVSFDAGRIADQPQFPGMAALTIALFALTSFAILSCSREVVARVLDAGAGVALHGPLVISAFVLPLLLGPVVRLSSPWVSAELATALGAVAFATVLTLVVWRSLALMQELQRQRAALLSDLEDRVSARTSELAAANAQLRESQALLLDANRHKDEFLAMLSHELRNPLAPIRTGVELLKDSSTSPSVRAEVHRVVERQMTHMVRLIDDLLDVSRINAGKLALHRERIDLRDVVGQAIDATRSIVERRGHELSVELPPDPVAVEGDPTRLAQVVANLIDNACKYTPRGGRLAVGLHETGDAVELRVRDNGLGIPPEFLPRIFEKFAQAQPASDDVHGGLGLGLALVRGIVLLHGGSVQATSEGLHRGSEFTVRLPRPRPAPVPRSIRAPDPAPVGGSVPRRVLVVDDNTDNTTALAMLLRKLGHEVAVAEDGEAALARATEFRPDVVLLDIGIPKLNGYDVCRRLREYEWGRRIRVVAQTGFGDEQDRRRSAEAGFDGHLVKPIDPSRLDAVLQL